MVTLVSSSMRQLLSSAARVGEAAIEPGANDLFVATQLPRLVGGPRKAFDSRRPSSHRWVVSLGSNSRATALTSADAEDDWSETTLPKLIRAAQSGNREAVREFLVAIAPAVRRTCRSVLGPDHADLEDTIQDSLLAAVKALPQYRFDGAIRRYVSTIALRLAITARRRSVSRWRRHTVMEIAPVEAPTAGEATESLLDGMGLVRRIVDELAHVQSEALLMRMILGLSIEEIADRTGVSPNTVKTRLRRGKNAMREKGEVSGFWQRLFLRIA